MNSHPALASLRAPFRGLFFEFAAVLRPFNDFICVDHYYDLSKKYALREKKQIPVKENVGHIGSQFYQLLLNAVQLLPEHLTRSRCNGSQGDDGMPEEMKTELSGIYRLIIHWFLCITTHLSGKPYAIQLIWGKYNEAEEESFALLESLRTLLVDLAKYVDALLGFISKFAKRFYSSGKVTCKDASELSLEVADNMQQHSEALEVCCKTILKHIELLCQPELTYSKSIQGSMTSKDSIKEHTVCCKNLFLELIPLFSIGATVDKGVV